MGKAFHTAHRWELDWEDDVDVLSLRDGVQVKVFYSDPEAGVADMLIKFPPGYTEPEHAHHSSHSILVLEGVQIVKGVHLHPATTSGRPVRSRTARTSTRRAAWSSPRSAACPPSTVTEARPRARSSEPFSSSSWLSMYSEPMSTDERVQVHAPRMPSSPNSRAALADPMTSRCGSSKASVSAKAGSARAMSNGRSVPSRT